ncbi:hypothetical protein DYU11_11740 [Fibrisoma montanum]|uniref:Uncharacterized protein n=1 Tax=Fibrisoma montanum TaxID=2305895 RepID=A0A418MBE6_9BACT|nr:hypothetical protein [Fibrisoma montanum]RIV23646.1 hypothetical protein DYU11_11740 [Fibrisoma montanum]
MSDQLQHPINIAQRRAELLDCIRDNAVNLADAVRQAKQEGLVVFVDVVDTCESGFKIHITQVV